MALDKHKLKLFNGTAVEVSLSVLEVFPYWFPCWFSAGLSGKPVWPLMLWESWYCLLTELFYSLTKKSSLQLICDCGQRDARDFHSITVISDRAVLFQKETEQTSRARPSTSGHVIPSFVTLQRVSIDLCPKQHAALTSFREFHLKYGGAQLAAAFILKTCR